MLLFRLSSSDPVNTGALVGFESQQCQAFGMKITAWCVKPCPKSVLASYNPGNVTSTSSIHPSQCFEGYLGGVAAFLSNFGLENRCQNSKKADFLEIVFFSKSTRNRMGEVTPLHFPFIVLAVDVPRSRYQSIFMYFVFLGGFSDYPKQLKSHGPVTAR